MDYETYRELPAEVQALLLEIEQYSEAYERCLRLYRVHDIPDFEESSVSHLRVVREAVARFDERPPEYDRRRFAGWL